MSLQICQPIKITVRHQRLIKIFHIFCASLWGGSTVSVALVQCFFQPTNASELYASSLSVAFIDYYIVAPSAIGCLLTGFSYAVLTKYGFIKYKWIIFKWIMTIAYLAFGFLWYVPWLERLVSYGEFMNNSTGILSETLPVYVLRITMDIVQLIAVFTIVSISVIKPWGRTRSFSMEKRLPKHEIT
jgi:uncharacterized membrane protein